MAWTPQKQVIDLTTLIDNLLAYVEEKDADALAWAVGEEETPPAEFVKFYSNASGRLQTVFPSFMVLSQQCETDLRGEILQAGLELTIECTISGSDPDELVRNTRIYAKAVESLLANIPSATFTANALPAIKVALMEITTQVDILRGHQTPSAFTQIFQTRCGYLLTQAAF